MSYYDFVKDYMKVDECKNNEKYSSAGHTILLGKKRIQLIQKAYIGFMKEAASLSIYMIFISKRK